MCSLKTDFECESFTRENLFPLGVTLDLKEFREFYDTRTKLLGDKLRPILGAKAASSGAQLLYRLAAFGV